MMCRVAIKQQGRRGVFLPGVLACQWIRRFGTIRATSRYSLRRFRWQAIVFLPNLIVRGETMNKKLVALAVGSAFALPLAAQAQTANVTLYGRLNMDLEFVNGKTCQGGATNGAGSLGTTTGAGQSTGGIACSGLGSATPANI